jgi:outer membrane protein assembly factor BamB
MSDVSSQAAGDYLPFESAPPLAAETERDIRLWPAAFLILAQTALIFVPPLVSPGTMMQFMLRFYAPMVCGVLLLLWWMFASRVSWTDRCLGLGTFAAAVVGTAFLCHPSFRFGLLLYSLPIITSAWVVWLVVSIPLAWPLRLGGVVAVFLAVGAGSTLVRMAGVTGAFSPEVHWRWTPTPEEEFLAAYHPRDNGAQAQEGRVTTSQAAEWPGFRGPERDGRLKGVRIGTDWAAQPPRLVWRHRVGPGWSSFAVVGRMLYTQEQRGKAEAVVCYDAATGDEVWLHEDGDRFEETVSGAGPRATPTFHDGNVYAFTAKGQLHCLDASTGRVVWSRNAKEDSGADVPIWGFASSPLVFKGVVTVFTGGPDGKSVTAYDAAEGGEPLWQGGEGRNGYSSPQPARLGGVDQVVIASDVGLTAFHPTQGDVLWKHEWKTSGPAPRCVQPALIDNTDLLLATGMGLGERRVHVEKNGDEWSDGTEVWTSKKLNAYYNDRVIHKGHVYGFDNNMFTCLGLDDGKARWRGGRYGNGQVLLLPDQDLLLVLSEKGEVVLVAADPEKHRELGRFQAIEGKTWNHPVIARGRLYVRNGEEAACYELPGWKETE